MRCPNPKCGKDSVIATDTRAPKDGGVWAIKRRRRCDACNFRFTTTEIMDAEFERLHTVEEAIKSLLAFKQQPPDK